MCHKKFKALNFKKISALNFKKKFKLKRYYSNKHKNPLTLTLKKFSKK